MAVDEINASGGIAGRKVVLAVEDDLGTPAGARAAEETLIKKGVAAVVGHYTSNQTLDGYTVTEEKKVVLLSGTAATSALTGKKDYFFRTVASTNAMGEEFARYIRLERGLARVPIILDRDNASYSDPLAKAFTFTFKSLGGAVPEQVSFSGAAGEDFGPLVDTLQASSPDGIVIIASPASAALIAQVIALKGLHLPLFSSGWGQGDSLIQNGGKAVEGMEIIIGIDVNDPSERLRKFKARYQETYSRAPNFAAVEGYETMQMLAAALQKTGGNAAGLPEALSSLRDFQGLSDPIHMDEYGDAVRPFIIQRIQSGSFQTILKVTPEN
jgi:branched-chain amino acid transport system substrate-binding protein